MAVGWFNAGTSLGALIAPPVVVAVALWADWRTAFLVTGGVGIFWAAAWYVFYRSPDDHPAITPEEKAMIAVEKPRGRSSAPRRRTFSAPRASG